MGSGKGNPEYWVAVVKPGRVLFEIGGVPRDRAEEALRRAAMKMPMDCRFLERQHVGVAAAMVEDESPTRGRGGGGMKPAEIRAMDDGRLDHQLAELQAEWRNLRFQEAVGKLTATARIRQIRKDIARIKTIQTERVIEAEYAALRQTGSDSMLEERSRNDDE